MKTNQKRFSKPVVLSGSFLTTLAFTVVLVFASAWMVQRGDKLEVELKATTQKELIDGDLEGAIAGYKSIVAHAGANRTIAAKALVQMGKCYEKLGNSEARKAYQQVLRDFADQLEQVELARARLAALKAGATAQERPSTMAIRRVPNGDIGQTLDMQTKPSPDGKYLAYTDWDTGNLAILDVATGAKRLLTKEGSWKNVNQYADFCAWSRDSKRIAFQWSISEPEGWRNELRVVSLDGNAALRTIATPGAISLWPMQWTRDGLRILCEYTTSIRKGELVFVPVDGGELEKLNIEMGQGRWVVSQLIEDDTSILYSNPSDGNASPHDIFVRNLRTGATMPVIQHPAEDLLVGVIPGTDWLMFASNRRGRLDLWGVQFRDGKTVGTPALVEQGIGRFFPLGFTDDGRYYYATLSVTDDVFLADFDPESRKIIGTPRKLASQWEGANMGAKFSPDGESLAYVTKRSPMPIPTHTADSLVLQSLKNPKADPVVISFGDVGLTRIGGACWLENGQSVVIGGEQGKQSGLYRIELPGLKKTRIYSALEGERLSGHVCSSRGHFVYSVAGNNENIATVRRIDINGGHEKELYKAKAGRTSIALSPDGETLSVVQSIDRNRRELLLLSSMGGTARPIHQFVQSSGGVVTQTWSPDGKSIFYIVRGQQPIDSEGWHWVVVRVPVDGGDVSEQQIKFNGPFFHLQFNPNGRLVAFTGRSGASTESEVWVIENLKTELKALLPAGGGGQ